ncbi:SRPBCC family protein [Streptomyces sp. V4-01]|uniref:SRPBCC family protein n=1 Tax=Actinacidiphila polyblastidii TaxID=3110430 RepID=A0ABU7P428_9ACTN|nr:SRPBCC family protein [Streptomyces sp. V4-01]
MALFVIERTTPLPPAEAWRRLTDWQRHAAAVPLTRITVPTPPPAGAGTVVLARTGVGRLGFDDPMRITAWRPEGPERHCRLEKTGRTVTGWAEIDVSPDPHGGSGAAVRWREDLQVRGVPRALDGVTAQVGRRVFGRVVDLLLTP